MKAKRLRKLFREQFGRNPKKSDREVRQIDEYPGVGFIVGQQVKDEFRQFKKLYQ